VGDGFLRAIRERLVAHRLDRIGIPHQHDRRRTVGLPELAHRLEHNLQARVVLEGALARALNGRAISHRIGERDSKLDDVRTRLHERMHQRHRRRRIGITCRDERDQRLAIGALQFRECRSDA
jgi:hypothetical protein